MTYRELLGYAQKKIDNNEITVGEYIEMTKALNREVDALDKIHSDIFKLHPLSTEGECLINTVLQIIEKYMEGEQK